MPRPPSQILKASTQFTALAEVQLVVGDDVVEAAADQAEGHGPDGDVGDRAGFAAAGDPALLPSQTATKTPMMMQKA